MTSLSDELKTLRRLKQAAETLKKQSDDAALAYKLAERKVFERMESEDCQSQKVGNVTYVRSSTVYAQVQDEGELLEWARANGQDDLFAPKPRKKLLNELAREHLNDSQPLPPGLGFYTQDYVAQRGGSA